MSPASAGGNGASGVVLRRLLEQTMPYGRHAGRRIADLPGSYLNWFARRGFPAGELGRLLALMHELDHNGLAYLLDPLRGGTEAGSGGHDAGSGQPVVQELPFPVEQRPGESEAEQRD